MGIINILLIAAISLLVYCYAIYPFLIRVLGAQSHSNLNLPQNELYSISIILAAYNEEKVLERCLDSILALDYPKEKLEILVGSDGSNDLTCDIVKRYYEKNSSIIKPFYFQTQRGKMAVLNDLVSIAQGTLLFFTDADIQLTPNTLQILSAHFIDEKIGAVAGSYSIASPTSDVLFEAEKEYGIVEEKIRIAESNFHSTVGLSGGNYLLRAQLWKILPDSHVHDDLFVVLSVLDQGYKIQFEPLSIASETFTRTIEEEFRRKARFASRGFHTISYFQKLLLPRAGKTAFLLWSHKILRWSSPFLIIAITLLLLLGNAISPNNSYGSALLLELVLFLVGGLGVALEKMNINVPILRQISWLFVMIAAYGYGTMKYLTGSDEAVWKASTRPDIQSHPTKNE